ncbi:MAG TPA: hypothetical protein VF421_15520 [Niabella sp.]
MKRIFFKCCYCLLLLLAALKIQAQSGWQNKACVKKYKGVPTLFINSRPWVPFMYMSYLGTEKYYREVAATGIHLYGVPCYLGDRGINTESGIGPFRKPLWLGKNRYDFSAIAADLEKILTVDTAAKVILRVHLDPPEWWEKANPGAACWLPDGTLFRQSFFSEQWRQETGYVLKSIIQWLKSSRYNSLIAGIHVAAGGTEEWVYHYHRFFYDENPVRIQAFRKWLRKKYADNADALRRAWNLPGSTFNNALPAEISGHNTYMAWLKPDKDAQVLDTYRFHAETLAGAIAYFCKLVKEASNDSLLTGAFYGYHYAITDPRKGHGALAKLLNCPYLDYLSSPNDYNRVAGEDWPPMVAVQSVQLHGKLWLAENDTRTSVTTLLKDQATGIAPPGAYESGVWLGPEDMDLSVAFLRKNLGRMLTQGYGGWWFDMWGGWFSDPRLLAVFREGQRMYEKYPASPIPQMNAGVCVFVDEELCFRDASLGKLVAPILANRYALGKTGAPYDLFLRSDIERLRHNSYKVIWMMGALELNPKEKVLLDQWRRKGAWILWTDGERTTLMDPSGYRHIYKGKLSWSAGELRACWRQAGIPVYITTNDVLYAGRGWLCLHTAAGGKKTIRLPFRSCVINAVNDQVLESNTAQLTISLPPQTTLLLRLKPVL